MKKMSTKLSSSQASHRVSGKQRIWPSLASDQLSFQLAVRSNSPSHCNDFNFSLAETSFGSISKAFLKLMMAS